jgi:hypothetical protein
MSPLPGAPAEVGSLRITCKQFSDEIKDEWHSEVTYHFPSTVAFLDVLSQWREDQVCKLRYVHVIDTPLPLYAFDDRGFYVTHNFSQALPMFPGLQLDLLTIDNIWLLPSGEPLDSWCFGATNGTIKRLLLTDGWKRLEYHSGILAFTPTQMDQLEAVVENHRIEQAEPDFSYGLGRVRPLLYSRENLLDPSEDPEDRDITAELVTQWYEKHAEERQPSDLDEYYPTEVTELHVAMWAERGAQAKYIQDGSEISSTLESLKSNISWSELRRNDKYLVDDGLDNPTAHL